MSAHPYFRHFTERGLGLLQQGVGYYAVQSTDGSYRPVTGHPDAAKVASGEQSVGFYAIRFDNLTRWGCADFDDPGELGADAWREAAQTAYEKLCGCFAETWLEESSPGRYHVWALSEKLMPASEMRKQVQEAAPLAGEVFPKQDTLGDKPNAKGSLVRFPGKHAKKETWSQLLACKTAPLEKVPEMAKKRRYELQKPGKLAFAAMAFACTTRGQSHKKLWAMACALRNHEHANGEKTREEVGLTFWQWWNVSAKYVDQSKSSESYLARWWAAWERATPATEGLAEALKRAEARFEGVNVTQLLIHTHNSCVTREVSGSRIMALCEELARPDGTFYLDCRTAGSFAGVAHMTALRWLNENMVKVKSGSYATRKSNDWRLPKAQLS